MHIGALLRGLGVVVSAGVFAGSMGFAQAAPALSSPTAAPGVTAMKLVSAQSGWLQAGNRVFWTDTLGASWTEITPPLDADTSVAGVSLNAQGKGLAVELSGDQKTLTVERTLDRGATWTASPIDSPFTTGLSFGGSAFASFPDEQHGWLMLTVASSSNFKRGILLQTTDGGIHWTQLPTPVVGANIVFTSATAGFAGPGVQGNDLYKTADGGQTWKPATAADAIPAELATSALAINTAAAHSPSLQGPGAFAARSSFVSPTHDSQGWVLFQRNTCTGGVCTHAESLEGTSDGGKTFFALGAIPGVSLESSNSFTVTHGFDHPVPGAGGAKPQGAATTQPRISVQGFDACSLPTLTQLQDWIKNSPYTVVGIYFGGSEFACSSGLGSLTPSYVASVLAQGWGIIPIWVGPQAPSGCCSITISTTSPATDGTTQADLAAAAVNSLGNFGTGNVIYYDMEAFDTTNGTAVSTTQSFVQAWDTELHRLGYVAAIYSGHPEIPYWDAASIATPPDDIWFTYFFSNGVSCGAQCDVVFGIPNIPDNYWTTNQRLRQTSSAFTPTYGTTSINIDEDWIDGAVVVASTYSLTVTKSGTGTGTVTSADATINCGTTCTASYTNTTTETLTATAAAGSVFTSWTGCTSTAANVCTVSVNAALGVTVVFSPSPYSLAVTKSGTGTGTVTSADATINCGTACSASYNSTTSETLTATPAAGSIFTSWTGCTSTTNVCTLSVSSPQSVTAVFSKSPYTLAVTKSGTGTGTVTSADATISCGATCSAVYNSSTTETLTAVAAAGSTFTSWTGCTSTAANVCTVTVGSPQAVTVVFTNPYTLAVSKSGTGTGTITSADSTINCGTTCSATYTATTVETLTATPAAGSVFTSWTGCTSTTNVCTVSVSTPQTVSAVFTVPFTITSSTPTLTIVEGASGTSTITVTPTSASTASFALSCAAAAQATFPSGTTCTFVPPTLTAAGTTAVTSILTISLTSTAGHALHASLDNPSAPSHTRMIWLGGSLLAFLLIPFANRKRLRTLALLSAAASGLLLTQTLTGCGGSSSPAAATHSAIYSGTIEVVAISNGVTEQTPIALTITN